MRLCTVKIMLVDNVNLEREALVVFTLHDGFNKRALDLVDKAGWAFRNVLTKQVYF